MFLPFLFIISLLACCIEVEISVPGFPAMSEHFAEADGMIQLTLAYNLLGFCLGSIFYGPLSDAIGRRPIMLIGSALLACGAFWCVYAPTLSWLYVARFIQGVGASSAAVLVFAMIGDLYTGEKSVKLIGIMNAFLTLFITLAPVVGGYINEAVGWQGNFFVVALISFLSWILLVFLLPETNKNLKVLNVKQVSDKYVKLLTSHTFMSASFAPSLNYAAYLAFVACGAFLYMDTFCLPMWEYVLHQGFIVACFSLVSLFAGVITKKIGSRSSVILGSLFALFGAVALVLFGHSSFYITGCMSLFCIGFAILYPALFSASLEMYPDCTGVATSAIMAMRALICAIVLAITGWLYDGTPLTISLLVLTATFLSALCTFNFMRSKIERNV